MDHIKFIQRMFYCLASMILSCSLSYAQNQQTVTPSIRSFAQLPAHIDAESWILIDFPNGEILYKHNETKLIPPASLTKLMVLHLAYRALEQGTITRDTLIKILPRHTARNIPFGASLMYLEPGYSISFFDLMKGAAISSGNDAAYLIAETLAGSVEKFVVLMNKEAERLGLTHTHFIEPTGLSEKNISNAIELAQFSLFYIKEHPYALQELNNLPFATAVLYGAKDTKYLNLNSTNDLLTRYSGCDGLKTGYIRESGYNFITTAKRGDTRFILVTLGGREGTSGRARTAQTLLDWAFENWETIIFPKKILNKVRVWYGKKSYIEPVMSVSEYITIQKIYKPKLTYKITYEEINAPIAKGQQIGNIFLIADSNIIKTVPLLAPEDIPRGNILIRIRDFFLQLFYHLFS